MRYSIFLCENIKKIASEQLFDGIKESAQQARIPVKKITDDMESCKTIDALGINFGMLKVYCSGAPWRQARREMGLRVFSMETKIERRLFLVWEGQILRVRSRK